MTDENTKNDSQKTTQKTTIEVHDPAKKLRVNSNLLDAQNNLNNGIDKTNKLTRRYNTVPYR